MHTNDIMNTQRKIDGMESWTVYALTVIGENREGQQVDGSVQDCSIHSVLEKETL